jgi:hypothetical protein
MIAAHRINAPCRQRHPLAQRKPASGGLRPLPRHRLSRFALQPTEALSKNRLHYDGAWRGSPTPQKTQPAKPAYCSSLGYKIGDFVDSTLGGGAQTVGTGTVIAGGAVGLATAITGVGIGAGGAIAGVGGTIYAGGTALSVVGNGIKFLSGQSAGVTAGSLIGLPTTRLGPASQIVTNSALSYFVGKSVSNPCN